MLTDICPVLEWHISHHESSAVLSPNLRLSEFRQVGQYNDLTGNPLHPTSTATILTWHPFCLPFSTIGAYFAFFSSPQTSILFSVGTVSSIIINWFVSFDINVMSGLKFVIVISTGILSRSSRSKLRLQSLAELSMLLWSFLYHSIKDKTKQATNVSRRSSSKTNK